MPGTKVLEDLELIIEDIGGGGGSAPPGGGDGDGGDDGQPKRQPSPSSRRYSIAIGLAMVSILVFFLGLVVAFVVLEHFNAAWIPVRLPRILWVNTVVLIGSSITLELARRNLADSNLARFQLMWRVTTALGILFLIGQVIAWRELATSRVFLNSSQASAFFYIFTAAHGVHLLGGIAALLYVSIRKFEQAKISRRAASQVASYYWHFMDGLWVVLFALLYLGR
jgi:cytochrome c oxidase subunit III